MDRRVAPHHDTLPRFALAAAGTALAGSGRGHQAYVAVFVLGACLVAQVAVRPFKSRSQGRLETLSLLVSLVSLYLGQLFTLGGVGDVGTLVAVSAVVLVNLAFIVVVVRALATAAYAHCLAQRRHVKGMLRRCGR